MHQEPVSWLAANTLYPRKQRYICLKIMHTVAKIILFLVIQHKSRGFLLVKMERRQVQKAKVMLLFLFSFGSCCLCLILSESGKGVKHSKILFCVLTTSWWTAEAQSKCRLLPNTGPCGKWLSAPPGHDNVTTAGGTHGGNGSGRHF